MNILDLIIGIILVLFAISGLRKGLIIEAFYLASFIVGVYGAMYFSDVVVEWMYTLIDKGAEYVSVVAFVLTFVIFVVVIRLLGRLISELVSAINLGFFDKLGGFLFGIMKGALIVSVVILVFNVFGITNLISKDLRNNSLLYGATEKIATMLYDNHKVLTENVSNQFVSLDSAIELYD